jgi:hypothetical protein
LEVEALISRKLIIAGALCTLATVASLGFAQDQNEDDPQRASRLIGDAVKARGGETYLQIKSLVSRGDFTAYDKGVSGDPTTFVDYIVYPSRERTDFGKGDQKFVQSNSEMSNWVYDGAQKMIRDQKDEQIQQFRQSSRYDLDNLLRGAATRTDLKVSFAGHREIWRNTFADSVKIEFSDGGFAIVNFDTRSKLPISVEYKTGNEQGILSNEARYFRWVEFGGVMFPTLQDFYRDGKQTARVSFDEITFNTQLPDRLFAKPTNIKEVK